MNDMGRSIMACGRVLVVLLVISIPSVLTAGPQDYVCNEPFVVEATHLISSPQGCPPAVDVLNQLRPDALQALQATANSECQTAQDPVGNLCPIAVLLGREAQSAVNCAVVELAIPGVPGPGIEGSTISLTISGSFACQ